MMITNAGTLVRTRVSEVSQVGRNTQGVTLIRTAEDEKVVGLQRIEEVEEAELLEGEEAEVTEVSEASENTVSSDEPSTDTDSENEAE